MKSIVTISFSLFILSACNLSQGVKEAGDAIGNGAENIVEGVKQVPKAIGDASHKLDEQINK